MIEGRSVGRSVGRAERQGSFGEPLSFEKFSLAVSLSGQIERSTLEGEPRRIVAAPIDAGWDSVAARSDQKLKMKEKRKNAFLWASVKPGEAYSEIVRFPPVRRAPYVHDTRPSGSVLQRRLAGRLPVRLYRALEKGEPVSSVPTRDRKSVV